SLNRVGYMNFDNRIGAVRSPSGSTKSDITHNQSRFAKMDASASATKPRLPAELLILNRFGIGLPYLKAAWSISCRYGIPPFEILIAGGVISEEIWLESQGLLAREKARARRKSRTRILLLDSAINKLRDDRPEYSAEQTLTSGQAFAIFCGSFVLCYLFATEFQLAILVSILCLTVFYASNILMRGLLLADYDRDLAKVQSLQPIEDHKLPVYTVLVALYNEPRQIRDLVEHLWNLNWPKHKLDIKLVCEADDLETIAAIKTENLPQCFDLVMVPPVSPRTKPKALNYALPLAHGKYLVLYDAEDQPSPDQLREAYNRFLVSDADVACLQAPLYIHNHRQNWLCRMFAIEYLTLFNGILPVLAKWRVPFPLGGTSNHFRTDILRKVGAWDPYNVTEDADLGVRLFREGYRSETISLPTYEEAPPNLYPWLKQRTRWIKGWMQTILVHNRSPVAFFRDLGLRNGLAFHLFLTSIVISVIIHPIFLFLAIQQIANLPIITPNGIDTLILGTSIFNLVGGYTTYGLLAYAVLKTSGHQSYSGFILTIPFYWLLISVAGWRAIFHLIVKPHMWEKTPHGLSNTKFGPKV
ncbi:MAG: glycosyltransferase family 2 protein, partial [Pseudomonadota bacterium]